MITSHRLVCVVAVMGLITGSAVAADASSTSNAQTGTATGISAGGFSACALTPTKRVKCWGDNDYGQLAIGADTSDQLVPVLVPDLAHVQQISVGGYHACAVLRGGAVKCWGRNDSGQVGDGTRTERRRPTQVTGLTSGVDRVTAGTFHTCALMSNGRIRCWGNNPFGALGNGTFGDDQLVPRTVNDIDGASQVSAGNEFTCATVNERAKCWGYNGDGELGDDSTVSRPLPVQVYGLTKNVRRVVAGYYSTCALIVGGRLKCWGLNNSGEIGTGTSGNFYIRPQQVLGMSEGVTSVDPGLLFTCAVRNERAKCWGDNSDYQLGNGTTDDWDVPHQVSTLRSGVVQVNVSFYTSCALLVSGAAKCWGWNEEGEVGINSMDAEIPTPMRVLL